MEPATPVAATHPAPVWPRVGAVLSGAFDLLTQTRLRVRDGALYIGALGLVVLGPVAVASIAEIPRLSVSASGRLTGPGPSGALVLAWAIAAAGAIAVGIEAQVVAISILGGARVGRPMSLWEALRRSRSIFWRAFWAIVAVGFVTGIVTSLVTFGTSLLFDSATDAASVSANLLTGVIVAPLVYVPVGIVLGDVGAGEAIRRSMRLARARFRLALMTSIFAVVTQYILIMAALAGLDLAVRLLEPLRGQLERLDPSSLGGLLVAGVGVLIALFAYWTLSFTILALTAAPQVVAFLGLTGYSGGLDRSRDDAVAGSRPARPGPVSRPMALGAVAAAILSLVAIAGAVH
jgi:hypothetical protein